MPGDAGLESDQISTGSQPSGFADRITRAWGSATGRRAIVWGAIVLVVVVVVATGILVFSSLSGESPSYKSGFSSGGAVFAADRTGAKPSQACQTAAARPPDFGGVPSGGNAGEWVKGCVAAFEDAQNGN